MRLLDAGLAHNGTISSFIEIQNQFIGPNITHAIEACQLFYIPAILQEGWALYIWDMLSRIIHIIDPGAGPRGCNADQKDRHELIASRLHDALFLRLNDYFAGWPTPKENWTTKYPLLMQNPVTREESGLCVMHIIRYHDGEKARNALTKNTLAVTRLCAIQETMKLQGNQSSLPADALWVASRSFRKTSSTITLSRWSTTAEWLWTVVTKMHWLLPTAALF